MIEARFTSSDDESLGNYGAFAEVGISSREGALLIDLELFKMRFGHGESMVDATLSMSPSAARALAAQIIEVADRIEGEQK